MLEEIPNLGEELIKTVKEETVNKVEEGKKGFSGLMSKYRKGFAPLIVIIVVLAIVFGLGYFVYRAHKIPLATTPVGKEYKNQQYGFSFLYSTDFDKIKENTDNKDVVLTNSNLATGVIFTDQRANIYLKVNSGDCSNYILNPNTANYSFNKTVKIINGNTVIIGEGEGDSVAYQKRERGSFKQACIKVKDYAFVFTGTNYANDIDNSTKEKVNNYLDQVLQSFRADSLKDLSASDYCHLYAGAPYQSLTEALKNPTKVCSLSLTKQGLTKYPDDIAKLNLLKLNLDDNNLSEVPVSKLEDSNLQEFTAISNKISFGYSPKMETLIGQNIIFPNSFFVGFQKVPKCIDNQQCFGPGPNDGTYYSWETKTPLKTVYTWYKNNWNLSGGGGSIDEQDSNGTPEVGSMNSGTTKGSIHYNINISGDRVKTQFSIFVQN